MAAAQGTLQDCVSDTWSSTEFLACAAKSAGGLLCFRPPASQQVGHSLPKALRQLPMSQPFGLISLPQLWRAFFVCLFPGLHSTPGNGGLRLSCTRAPWQRAVESPWLRGGWQEHRARFVIMKNTQSTRWCVANRLSTARSEPCRWHEQGRGGVPRPVGFDLNRSVSSATGFTGSTGVSWEEVSAGTAAPLRSLQHAQISGEAAVKIEFMTWDNFIPSPCSFCSLKGWLEPSLPARSCRAGAGL